MSKEYRIAKLRELIEAKKVAEVHQKSVRETSDVTPIPDMPKSPRVILQVPGGPYILKEPEPRPRSLEGISQLDILLLYQDGHMSPEENRWFEKRSIPDRIISFNPHGC